MKRRDFLRSTAGMISIWPARRLLAAAATTWPDIPARTPEGDLLSLRGTDLNDLAKSLRGEVLLPSAPGYDAARRIWNGMFDNRPALIVRCAAPADVVRAVEFAHGHRLLTAVRAGGHSLSGKSTCDGGIVIDVSPMQEVQIDPCHGIAHVEGGALLRHLDRAALAHGLVTTSGTVSHTGAAGLTLGGGLGRVGRRFGLACDNLKSVDLVTADGRLITASNEENADLFWGLRGGGGNFGIATAFEYELHSMNPTILGGAIAWPIAQAESVLRLHADLSLEAPDELNLDAAMVATPDGALILIEACWSGDMARGEKALAPLRAFGRPAFDRIAPMPYLDLQSGSDGKLAHGIRFYGKSGFVDALTSRRIHQCIEVFESAPPGSFSIVFQHGGGAISRKPVSASAFPNRGSNYWIMLSKSWTDPAEDAWRLETLRAAWRSLEPLTRGFYVNAFTDDQRSRVEANYGPNYPRLQRLKRKYDPDNLFRLNANILPAADAA